MKRGPQSRTISRVERREGGEGGKGGRGGSSCRRDSFLVLSERKACSMSTTLFIAMKQVRAPS